ncbi:TonB-dependent receptor [Sphingomonas crocodyli]|uniref:TonB-dependent siderophore receptor n=1 Tax=Sphingomonas crocodyli TaxID=1979270 RepID=A0A437MAQ5_9SPHN|nr:TonB-dependent siderophore receptor [Sphingomonas crocodyli]RVT94737.1 TonB-dependent siderophore receptor [Sphingomonas crocodyli]
MKTSLALLTGCAGLIAAPLWAQEASDDIIVTAQQAQKQVVSDGNLGVLGNKSALETPFNVTTYTAQLVLDQQAETIGDVLKNEPSVRTAQGFGNQAELFVIRGFALSGDDVAMDGMFGITPRQLVSPELYESIQVLNGANAFLFGAAPSGTGTGGGINLIPKRAEKTLFRATASYGADSIFGGNFDAGTRFGEEDSFGIRVNGVYRRGDTAIDNDKRRVGVLGASFDFRRGPGRFFFDFGYENQQAFQPRPQVRLLNTGIAVPRVPDANNNYGQPWSFTKLRDIYALARVEVDVVDNVMVYAAAGIRDGREDGEYSTVTITNSTTGAATGARLFVPRKDNNQSGQAGIRGKVTFAGMSHEFNAGGSINVQSNRNSFRSGTFPAAVRPCSTATTVFCTNLYAPVYVAKPADAGMATGGSLTELPRVSKNAFSSLFLSDTIGFVEDRVLLTIGARRQHLNVEAYDRTSFRRTSNYNKTVTTPVVGLVVRPTDRISIYANRVEALAQGPTAPTNASNVAPGTVFPPFRSKQYEVGGKVAIRGLTATVALFQTKQPSARSDTDPNNAGQVIYSVDGKQRNRGIEISFNGEPMEGLRFIGGGTIVDAKLQKTANGANDGNRAVGVPPYQLNLGAEVVPAFLKNATFTGRIVRTGKQYVDVTNRQQLDAWTRFDVGMRYVVVADSHPITLRLSAENVANKRYWASSFGSNIVQGGPRTVKASATFEY